MKKSDVFFDDHSLVRLRELLQRLQYNPPVMPQEVVAQAQVYALASIAESLATIAEYVERQR